MFNFTVLPELGLYIHIPWCVRKCPYCDFNSHVVRGELPETEYIKALIADLEQDLPRIWGRVVKSIYIGGGTPSLFSAESIEALLSGLRARLSINPDAEITLEANPGTVEYQKFAEFKAAGINRLSIGIQSFNDDHLQQLGRIHDRRQAFAAAESAHKAGLENFNLDLMFALPGQSIQQSQADVRNAIDLEPQHISLYQLTLEPHTWFYEHPPVLPGHDLAFKMQQRNHEILTDNGLMQYEVSAYAKPGRQSRHNLNYWQFGDYLGIGAGAHGKLSSADPQGIHRLWKTKHPGEYLDKATRKEVISGESEITANDLPVEFMMNALRLTGGFDAGLFDRQTGMPLDLLTPGLHRAQEKDLIQVHNGSIRPTQTGQRFLDDLVSLFMDDNG
ncbi:MAG: radical SAM family heme chaperone HemW [Gammaproteobacteria bacterium]|nr:MAG: radical SAM family heme chaperone HemW [Gammaproteobacteria bacterium]